ncbi:reverse transcriptase domain-containing protein [Paenibacillus dokdonensis]|uniref:reverse transcriptase domain-containing protein n=1 Tax=Paenibacillus dokdonensis TaxID=2567944 RepID=UPI001457B541|nr:reverse transcriptase domain-containing protein [Paenibacillus dokdonensis]
MTTSIQLLQEKFTVEHLNTIYTDKVQIKATPGLDKINVSNFNTDEHINVISHKVTSGKYKFTPYKEKLLSKGRGKNPRVISIPTLRDKITLAALNEILTALYLNDVSAKISTTIVQEMKAAITSNSYDYFIKIDVKAFYDSIDHNILLNKVRKKIKNNELLNLIKSAVETPTVSTTSKKYPKNTVGVPQGISISNILANIYLNEIDKKFAKYKDVAYFRYVDDILILCTKKKHKIVKKSIVNDINKLKLSTNEKEDEGNLTKGFDYLGYQYKEISQGKFGFTVKDKNYQKLKDSLLRIITTYKNNKKSELFIWDINLRITGFIIDKTKYGWIFFYSQMDDISKLYELDWLVIKVCNDAGIDPSLSQHIKKFVRAYHEITKRKSQNSYIPRIENFTLSDKKIKLVEVYGFTQQEIDGKSDKEIHTLFKKKMYQSVRELEKDVQQIS